MRKITHLSELGPLLASHERFVLLSHARPDGDAIGSQIAMKELLLSMGKEVRVLNEDGAPDNLRFLAGAREVEKSDGGAVEAEVVIALDTANRERLGARCLEAVKEVPLWINIDHHISNENYGDYVYVNDRAAATGEIVFQLAMALDLPISDIARDALYVAVSTDTGSFQYSNTTAETYEMAAELVRRGVAVGALNAAIYHDYPFRRVELLESLLGSLQRSDDGRLAWWGLTMQVKQDLKIQPGDSEGLIDVLRAVQGVVACIVFEELSDGTIRVSSRSKDARLNVCKICQVFGGGGHVMASGARVEGPLMAAQERVIAVAQAAVVEAGIEPFQQ